MTTGRKPLPDHHDEQGFWIEVQMKFGNENHAIREFVNLEYYESMTNKGEHLKFVTDGLINYLREKNAKAEESNVPK